MVGFGKVKVFWNSKNFSLDCFELFSDNFFVPMIERQCFENCLTWVEPCHGNLHSNFFAVKWKYFGIVINCELIHSLNTSEAVPVIKWEFKDFPLEAFMN